MGEAKRNKARLGEWYGKPITEGHPDAPKPKPAPVLQNIVSAHHHTFLDGLEHRTQVDQVGVASDNRIVGIDPAMPGSDRTVVAVHRPNQSTAYRRANRNARIAVAALLGMVGVMGDPDDNKKDKS